MQQLFSTFCDPVAAREIQDSLLLPQKALMHRHRHSGDGSRGSSGLDFLET